MVHLMNLREKRAEIHYSMQGEDSNANVMPLMRGHDRKVMKK